MSSDRTDEGPPAGELLRALADAAPSMLAYWDADQRCRFANRAYERWFGVSPSTLIGKHIRELLGPALYELNRPHIEAALRGEPQEFERDVPDPRGGPRRASLAHYVPDRVGDIVRGFFVLVTDISAIKRAQAALEESEERFRLTIDEAPIGMALVDLGGRFMRVNRALCEIVGYAPHELTGLTFQAITHPDDLDTDLALAGELARGVIPRYQLEKRYVHKDGHVVHVLLSGAVLRGAGGAPRHFIAQIEDITDRKRAQDEQRFLAEIGPVLAESLDFEETLGRVAQLAVRDLADFCIVDVIEEDASMQRQHVVSRDPTKADACRRLMELPIDRTRPYLLRDTLETGRPKLWAQLTREQLDTMTQSDEHARVRREMDARSAVVVPLLAHDRLLGAIALISSRPERSYGPADLHFAEEIARRAALSIDNARLFRAAKRATQSRDDVLGIVAHDLRNPVNTILLQAALLTRHGGAHEDGGRAAVKAIEHAAARMNRLIQDLLDVTRMEAGRLNIEEVAVPAARVVSDAVAGQRALAAAASLELALDLDPELPAVRADVDRVHQVFENLVGNAVKFTPPGGRIAVGAAARPGEVLFWVADTGSGISSADLPHVFDRFWQARRAGRHGAGLGLPIVKGIIEAHRGRIWVESAPGRGSTFFFTLPAAGGARWDTAARTRHRLRAEPSR